MIFALAGIVVSVAVICVDEAARKGSRKRWTQTAGSDRLLKSAAYVITKRQIRPENRDQTMNNCQRILGPELEIYLDINKITNNENLQFTAPYHIHYPQNQPMTTSRCKKAVFFEYFPALLLRVTLSSLPVVNTSINGHI